jgi:pimeloyl-ACP methyl ester carboxylesterase
MPLSTPDVKFQAINQGDVAVRLAVHEMGSGKPIILLHGLGASSYSWHKIAPDLAKTNRVIAIDLKGFGRSDKPLDDRYSIFDQAQLVEKYIVERGLRGVTLVGHSFGGGVALALALSQKDAGRRNIERLVLIDSIAYRQPLPVFFQLLQTPVLGELGLSLIPPEVQIERALAIAYYEDAKVMRTTVKHYADPLHTQGGRHALLQTINSLDPAQADQISARYSELKTPALLLWCDHDKIVPLKYGKRLASDLANARIEIIEDCGHIPHEEQPEETLAAIQRFLR